jgi:hypothetical protein
VRGDFFFVSGAGAEMLCFFDCGSSSEESAAEKAEESAKSWLTNEALLLGCFSRAAEGDKLKG